MPLINHAMNRNGENNGANNRQEQNSQKKLSLYVICPHCKKPSRVTSINGIVYSGECQNKECDGIIFLVNPDAQPANT